MILPPTIYDYLVPKSVRMDLPRKIPASVPAGQVEREGSINSGAGICGLNTIVDPAPSHADDDGVKRTL